MQPGSIVMSRVLNSLVVSRLKTAKSKTLASVSARKMTYPDVGSVTLFADRSPIAQSISKPTNLRAPSILFFEQPDQAVRNSLYRVGKKLGLRIYKVGTYSQIIRSLSVREDIGILVLGASEQFNVADHIEELAQKKPGLCIVALAGAADREWAQMLVETGCAYRYLDVPLREKQFEDVIQAATRRHQMLQDMKSLETEHKAGFLKSLFTKTA